MRNIIDAIITLFKEVVMKEHAEFLNLELIPIDEASFSRIVKQMKEKDFAFLTGFLDKHSKKENRKRNKELISKFLRPHKIGPVLVKGFFPGEKQDDGTTVDVEEESLFFSRPDDMNEKDFKSLIIKILKAFGQTSALYGSGKGAFFIEQDGSMSKFADKANLNPKSVAGGYSQFRGHKFTFEGMYKPKGWIQALMLDSYGVKYTI